MNPVVVADLVALVAALVALVKVWSPGDDEFRLDVRPLALCMAALACFDGFSNVLEWGGVTAALDTYEDYVSILQPAFWFFLCYVFVQQAYRRDLARSEAFLATTLSSLGDGVIVTDTDRTIRLMNPVGELLSGWGADEALGRPFDEVVDLRLTDHDEPVAFDRLLTSLTPRPSGQTWVLRARDGRQRHVTLSTAPIRTAASAGRPAIPLRGAVVVVHDVTEQVSLEERLRQAQKLEAVGRLAGGIAHDFNNLMTAIMGHASLLKDDGGSSESIDAIIAGSRRAADLTSKLLAFSRKSPLVRTAADVNLLVRETVAVVQRTFPAAIDIVTDLDEHPLMTLGDPTQLQMVLFNLAINARDAMSSGGILTFRSDRVTLDDRATRRFTEPLTAGPYVRVIVRDTGVGMDDETQRHAFDPFFTTKPIGQGTGLGLAAAYGVIRQHQGMVSLTCTPGKGCTFEILLPAAGDEALAAAEAPASVARSSQPLTVPAGARALVVDDDDTVARLVASLLSDQGFAVSRAEDGVSALELFETDHDPMDLVVLDIVMPRLDGLMLLSKLRQTHPNLPVLLMSGHEMDMSAAMRTPRTAFLAKPFDRETLVRAIADLCPEFGAGRTISQSHGDG